MQDPNNISPSPKKPGRISVFNRIITTLNYIFVIALLISYLSPFVSPANFWYIAFFGLTYPWLVLANLFFVAYWMILWRKRFLLSLIVIAAGYFQLNKFVQLNLSPDKNDPENALKVLSYNVRVFDLYNWTHNKATRNKMFQLIADEAPDIMCLQEYYSDDAHFFPTHDTLVQLQKAKNSHIHYTITVEKLYHFGIATFTSHPIVGKGQVIFPENNNNICIYTDIKIKDDTVRVYNMHLQSIHFRKSDYKYIEDLMQNKETEDIENSKNILRRLKKGFQKRALQADAVAEHISQCKYPVIVCGDFNDTPSSYASRTISQDLKDAFVESGMGLGRTYIGRFPSFRIDYILHSKELESSGFQTIQENFSDHFPVSCYIEMENTEGK